MVEPLEETRSELVFATELLLSSLQMSMPNGTRQKPIVDLDEVEVRGHSYCLISCLCYVRSKKVSYNCAKGWRSCILPQS